MADEERGELGQDVKRENGWDHKVEGTEKRNQVSGVGNGLMGKGEATVRRNLEWEVEKLRKIPMMHRQGTILREVTRKTEKRREIE